ncbi:hypothetical protein AB1Y20_003178 [Prymnesium parvum]|uniref:Uncharacterized protein n=1 Tax=Prymnesium parvum TaxID=97485 RepID=A0AB34JDB0_PRYPA
MIVLLAHLLSIREICALSSSAPRRREFACAPTWTRHTSRQSLTARMRQDGDFDLMNGGWTADEWRDEEYWQEEQEEWREGINWVPGEDVAVDTAKYFAGTAAAIAFFDFISPWVKWMEGPNLNLFVFFVLFLPGLVWWVTFRPYSLLDESDGGLDNDAFFLPFGLEVYLPLFLTFLFVAIIRSL